MPRINVAITGSTESLERAFARSAASAKAWNVSINDTAVNLRRLEPAMTSLGRTITRTITVPTAAIGIVATKMGIDFNKQMLLIQTQAGASAGEVKKLSGEVLALAKVAPQGPTQLAQGLYHLESIGLHGAAAMKTLRIAALAAGMGIANLEDTTSALGGVVVTGIRGAQNYQQAMATLVATVGAGNVRMGDLAEAIGNVAPAAQAAGVSLPELGAAIATLTDRGFSADEATTRLRMSLALIQAPSEKAKKALKDMGVDAESLGATLRSPNGLLKVLQLLNEGVQRVGATRGNRDLLAGFGGGRSGLGIQTLVGSLNQGLSSYQQKLEDVGKDTQKFAANQKTYMESPAYKIAVAWSSVQASLIKLGAAFAPVAVKLAQAINKIADGFSALPKSVKIGSGSIIAVFAIGGPLLLGFAAVIGAITKIRVGLAALGPTAATSAAETAGALDVVGASATAANSKVLTLKGSLLGIAALAAAIPEAAQELSQTKKATKAFNAGGQPLVNPVPSNEVGKAITVGGKRYIVRLVGGQQFVFPLAPNTSGMSNDPLHDAGDRRQGTASVPNIPGLPKPGVDRATALNLAISRANLAVSQGARGAQGELVAALKAKIDFDKKWEGIQEGLIKKGVGNASQHAKNIQTLLQDETSARDQINSIESASQKDTEKKQKDRATATKKAAESAKKTADALKQAMQQALDAAKSAIGDIGSGPVATGDLAQTIQSFGGHLGAKDFVQDITQQNNQFAGFLSNLNRLSRRGAPAGLTQALFAQGQGGMAEAAALAQASPKVLSSFLNQYEKRQKLLMRAEKMEVSTPVVNITAKNVSVGRTDAHDRPGDRFASKASKRPR